MNKGLKLAILKRSQERIAAYPKTYDQETSLALDGTSGCLLFHHLKSGEELEVDHNPNELRVLDRSDNEYSSSPLWVPNPHKVTAADAVEFLQRGIDELEAKTNENQRDCTSAQGILITEEER